MTIQTRARFARPCCVCDELIMPREEIVMRKGKWAHARCMSGADD